MWFYCSRCQCLKTVSRRTVFATNLVLTVRHASRAVYQRQELGTNLGARWKILGGHHCTPSCNRTLSLTATLCSDLTGKTVEPAAGEGIPLPPETVPIFESSAQAKWASDAASVVSDLPTQGDFTSLGLGGYSPVGLIQWMLEYLHLHSHLPWWAAIVASTLVLRTLLFPVGVRVQANAAKLNNIRPEMDKLMAKIREHNQAGNTTLSAQQTAKLLALYQKHNCHPLKMMIMPLLQVPIFISFFIALRKMAAVPVESMKGGGMLWFTDLTVPDPYYVLPVCACLSFMAIIELGGEAGVANPQVDKMKTLFRGISILLIPVTATFPAGLFMYWLTASCFSMGQILLLRIPRVRTALGIPKTVKHSPQDEKQKQGGGIIATVKDNYQSALLIDQAKKREAATKKAYEKLRKNPNPKLYDKPPHRRVQE